MTLNNRTLLIKMDFFTFWHDDHDIFRMYIIFNDNIDFSYINSFQIFSKIFVVSWYLIFAFLVYWVKMKRLDSGSADELSCSGSGNYFFRFRVSQKIRSYPDIIHVHREGVKVGERDLSSPLRSEKLGEI